MNDKELASSIIRLAGGRSNVIHVVHCVTRLRFTLKDQSLVDDEGLEALPGVVGVAKNSQQYQVILGSKVGRIYEETVLQLGITDRQEGKDTRPFSLVGGISWVVNLISEILTPMVPALAAAGMLKVFLLVISQLHWIATDSSTYVILQVISDSLFYFMPVIVAYLAADRLHTNKVIAMVLAGVLLHPDFMGLISAGGDVTFLGVPVSLVSYSGSFIPSLLMVALLIHVERFAKKISPDSIRIFFQPLVTVLIVAPLTILVLGPAGSWAGAMIGKGASYCFEKFGWISVGLLGALLPFSVIIGLNRALTPVSIQIYSSLGYEPLFRVAYIGANMSQGAAALAVGVRTKNRELRQIAYAAGISTLLSGITEPSIFGVTLKLKRPLIATSIAGFLSGSYAGLMGVKAYAMAVPGLLSIPMFAGGLSMNLVHALIAFGIAIAGSFILTLILGFEDPVNNGELFEATNPAGKEEKQKSMTIEQHKNGDLQEISILSPVKGSIVQGNFISDKAFCGNSLGETIAVMPETNSFYPPISGTVSMIFPTGHAFAVRNGDLEVMVHIGIDTVKLEGKYFNERVKVGDWVSTEDVVVEIDGKKIREQGYDLTTFVILLDQQPKEGRNLPEHVQAGDLLLYWKGGRDEN